MKNKRLKLISRFLAVSILFSIMLIQQVPRSNAQSSRTVRVAVFQIGNFNHIDSEGNSYGYNIDYIKKIAQYSHWNIKFVVSENFNEALKMLDENKIDLVAPAQKTGEREEKYLFSTFSMGTEMGAIQTLVSRKDLVYGDTQKLSKLHYGAMKDSPLTTSFIENFCKNASFTPNITYYKDSTEMYEALYKGEVEAIATNIMFGDKRVKMIGRYSPQPIFYVSRKGDSKLMSELNDAMTELLLSDPNFQTELFASYFPDFSNTLFSQAEKSYIKSLSQITVGYKPGQAPISYIDKDGNFNGITKDVLDYISKNTGLKFKFEALPEGDYDNKYLKDHGISVVAGTEYSAANENSTVHMTIPYLCSEEVLVSTSKIGLSSDSKDTVAVPKDTKELAIDIEKTYPNCTVTLLDTVEKCFDAVKKGKVSAALINRYVADCKLSDPSYSDLKIATVQSISDKLCLCVHTDTDFSEDENNLLKDPMLISVIDKSIKQISTGTMNDMIIKNSAGTRYRPNFRDILNKNKYTVFAFLLLIFAVIIMLIWKQNIEKEKAAELAHKNRDLLDAVGQADKASKAKSQFLARMSHEIRTPMNAIVGITEIAKKHSDDPGKIREYLDKISASSQVLLNIINDVLDMSAIESSKLKIANSEFSLREILNNIDTVYSPQCFAKNIDFSMFIDLDESKLIGDSLRVQQILLNLVSNAYKFTLPGGKIQLCVKEVSKSSEKVFIKFSVSDTGIGIPKEMLPRLFKPFEQESAKIAQNYGGSGLGLSITKNLVEMMNGAIKVESVKGEGSTFTVDIPFEYVSSDEPIKECNVSGKIGEDLKYDFSGHKILLCEDNELNREIAVELLKFVNLEVDCAENGVEAVEKFTSSQKGTYEAILMDIQMPVMNGNIAAEKIRKSDHPDSKTIKIFAMTANAFSEDISASLNSGMNGHISKPIDTKVLYKTLSKAILEK